MEQTPQDLPEPLESELEQLLQELRVALPGVQILFAFLLTVPFSMGFQKVTSFQRTLFFITLLATAASTVCLIAPTATHRLRFHGGDRRYIIESANRLLIAGLVFLAVAIICALSLITDYLFGLDSHWYWPALVGIALIALWFVRPLLRRLRGVSSGP